MDLFNQELTEGRLRLTLQDANGVELKFGDIVAISDGRHLNFYCEVAYLEDQKAIAPFHTFSLHNVKKVDKLPEGVVRAKEERYKVWYHPDPKKDKNPHEDYLMSWRSCEKLIRDRMFKIEIV